MTVEVTVSDITLKQLEDRRDVFLKDLGIFLHTFQGWTPTDFWGLTLDEYDSLKSFLEALMPGDGDGAG